GKRSSPATAEGTLNDATPNDVHIVTSVLNALGESAGALGTPFFPSSNLVKSYLTTDQYLFLRARKLTAFWIAPTVGFIVGAATWCATFALFGLSLKFAHVLEGGGLLGGVVGTILWLIARPDRQTQATA